MDIHFVRIGSDGLSFSLYITTPFFRKSLKQILNSSCFFLNFFNARQIQITKKKKEIDDDYLFEYLYVYLVVVVSTALYI